MNIIGDVSLYQLKIVFISLMLKKNFTHFEGFIYICNFLCKCEQTITRIISYIHHVDDHLKI